MLALQIIISVVICGLIIASAIVEGVKVNNITPIIIGVVVAFIVAAILQNIFY